MRSIENFFDFIKSSPTAIQASDKIRKILNDSGFTELSEKDAEAYRDGGKHFVVRSDSTVIAFKGGKDAQSFMICSSHNDTPAFKLTSTSEAIGVYSSLSTEKYGGSILYSWLNLA